MRDAKSIMQNAKELGVVFHTAQTEKCLNKGLELLYVGENVITYIVDDSNRSDIKKIYLLTDHNRLINCIEEKTEYSGFNIFKSNDYMHYAAEFDLNCLVPEKTSYNLYKEKGLFGAKYAEITLYFREEREDSLAQIITSEATAEPAYQVILAHAQEYGAKPEEEPKKSSKKEAASAGGGKEAEMKQIREMHEAGLITKEEMMELMKSLLNK